MAGRWAGSWLLLALLLAPGCRSEEVRAAGIDVCANADPTGNYGSRIAAVACAEHRLWFAPFVDADGRLASMTVAEAETSRLRDGATPAWRRVVDYWKGSGLLASMAHRAGANDCAMPAAWPQEAACRAFVIDTPWSAAFVSFVMLRAGVPGFMPSASHIDFMREAYLRPDTSPFRFADPDHEAPAAGDLLCFARGNGLPIGHAGLRAFLDGRPDGNLTMHCDVVVAANPHGDGRVQLVGGNVLQGVTLRMLHVNRKGLLWGLPRRGTVEACGPANPQTCSFNRQDWVALLKLKPLPAPTSPLPGLPPVPGVTQPCCTTCPLPMPPGVHRCPAPPPQGAETNSESARP